MNYIARQLSSLVELRVESPGRRRGSSSAFRPVESPVDLTSYDIPFRRTFGAFSHICTLTCRGDVTYSIERNFLPAVGPTVGRPRVAVVHPHRAPRSSPRPRPAPYRIKVQSLFEPTHGKTTKIALQATPELRSYRITSSRPLLFAGLQGGERPTTGLLRRRSRPQT